jgi:hypothetical protein
MVNWELAPDDDMSRLARQIALALDSTQRRLSLAAEITLDADEMTGWFVKKKRFNILSSVQALQVEATDNHKEINEKTINYATSSKDAGKELAKALAYIAGNGIKDPEGDTRKFPKKTTEALESLRKQIDERLENQRVVSASESPLEENILEEAPSEEKEGKDESPSTDDKPSSGADEPSEFLGSDEEALEELKRILSNIISHSEEREQRFSELLALVEKHQTTSYLERKKLSATVNNTVGTLEQGLTENKLNHSRLEKHVMELTYRVSQAVERVKTELSDSIQSLKDSGTEKWNTLHEALLEQKTQHTDKINALSSDCGNLKDSLELTSKNCDNLSSELKTLSESFSEYQAKNSETVEILRNGVDELKGALSKSSPDLPELQKVRKGLFYLWGILVSALALAAFIAALVK